MWDIRVRSSIKQFKEWRSCSNIPQRAYWWRGFVSVRCWQLQRPISEQRDTKDLRLLEQRTERESSNLLEAQNQGACAFNLVHLSRAVQSFFDDVAKVVVVLWRKQNSGGGYCTEAPKAYSNTVNEHSVLHQYYPQTKALEVVPNGKKLVKPSTRKQLALIHPYSHVPHACKKSPSKILTCPFLLYKLYHKCPQK